MLACIGDATVDVIAWPKGKIKKEAETKAQVKFSPGGQASNFARFSTLLGLESILFARVGDDHLGKWLVETLESLGVKCRISVGKGHTAKTVALVFPDGTRAFLNDPGENACLSLDDIDFGVIEKSKHVHVGGYWFLKSLMDDINKLFKFTRDNGIQNSLSIGWDPEGWIRKKQLLELLQLVDIFFLNERELETLTGNTDYRKACEMLNSKITVVHRGKKGCFVKTKEKYISVPAKHVSVVNPVGAGDAFDAAFIHGLMQELDLEEATQKANEFASKQLSGKQIIL